MRLSPIIRVKSHLNYVDGTGRVVPEKSPSYHAVDETVSHDFSKKSPQLCQWHGPGSSVEGS